jgi:CIC family chloride channel protein
LQEIMTPRPIAVRPSDPLSQVLHLLSRYKLSRLPVVEQRHLVGIITRSDILRVEADKLQAKTDSRPQAEPSYTVYQTRSPTTGKGRLLLPLSNPQTATPLLKMALAIAQQHDYEIECLQIVLVPRHTSPAETTVDITNSRQVLALAEKQAQSWNIRLHTQIRASHTVSRAILDAVTDRHINLLLMGWKGTTSTPGRIFGDVVDAIIRQATADVVLVKLGNNFTEGYMQQDTFSSYFSVHATLQLIRLNRWLVPIAGGPNAQHAITLLPALVSLSHQPEIRLCQVFHPSDTAHDTQLLEEDARFLRQRTQCVVNTIPVCADSVAAAIVDMAQKGQCDVVVLGASRDGLLKQAIQGNIPEAIARNCNCTVILVRKAIG